MFAPFTEAEGCLETPPGKERAVVKPVSREPATASSTPEP